MSKKCLGFLRESFLYSNNNCEQMFSKYIDAELLVELQKYRSFVVDNAPEIQSEIQEGNKKLNICIETFSGFPTEGLYKQLVLYMDQVVIPDPLFSLTETHSAFANAMGSLMGFNSDKSINRKELCDSIEYIKCIGPLVDAGFVVIMPLSLMHEAPKKIPITYSPNAFADVIPKNILNYYRSVAKVCNLERSGEHLYIKDNEPLRLGVGIYVQFDDDHHRSGSAYQYMNTKILDYDEKTGDARIGYRLADSITESEFNAWVNQSINQAANHHFCDTYKELIFSKQCGCMYLSQSSLTANILGMAIEKPSIDSELASMAMNMELPVTSQIPMADLLSIRRDYGEAFYNFRTELNSKLLSVDTLSNSESIVRALDRISYELNNTQVKEVEKEYRKIVRTLKLDALALSGTLVASLATGGITAVGAAAAFVKGTSDIGKYFTEVNENNGFFLWKLNKRSQKYLP